MKRFACLSVVCLVSALVAVNIPALAQTGPERNLITVSGSATDTVAPDTAVVVLSVETIAKTVKQATQLNNQTADKVISAVKKEINKNAGDSIKTSLYNVSPNYEYDNGKKRNVLTGYRAMNQVTVTTKQTDKVGSIIDSAIEAGATNVQNVGFTTTQTGQVCKAVLEQATQSAKFNAQTVAQSLGARITGVKNVNASCSTSVEPRPMYRSFDMAGAEMAKSAGTPIEAGESKIFGTVNVDFIIEK